MKITDVVKEDVALEGEVIQMQPRNPLNQNLITQLKSLSQTALGLFWGGSNAPTAMQAGLAQMSQQEQTRLFNRVQAQLKALGYEDSIVEEDMDLLSLHSLAREAWNDSGRPMSQYRGLPDLEYNYETDSLRIIDLIQDDDAGTVYDKTVYEQGEGNFVGDFPQPNIGGATVKSMQVGDTVTYFGQTAKIQAQSPDRKHSRIEITKGTGGVVQTVLTSDLKRVHQGTAEGEVVPLGKKHRGDLDSVNSCSKCGGKLEGGTYMGQRIKVCQPCKQVYLPPNSGIDQQGNKIKEQGMAEGLKQTLRKFDPTIKARIRQKSQDQTNQGIDTIQHLADLDLTSDDMVSRAMKPNTYFKNAERYAKLANKGVAEGSLHEEASKLLSAQDKDGIITIIVQAPDGTKRSAASSNPNAINKWLMKYGLRLPKNIADLFVGVTEEFRPTTGQAMGIRSQIAQKMNPGSSKFIWKRPNQIMGSHTENELKALKFRYSAKYNSWGGTQQMWGQLEGNLKEFAPTKPPTAGAFGGNKDYGQPTSSRYSNGNKFVLGTTNNYVLTATVDKWGLEWDEDNNIWYLDSPGAAHIADATEGEIELPAPQEQRNQIHDLVTDYLNDHNSAELQRVAAYYGHSADGEMATSEGVRVPAQQILGTKNRAKSAYYPTNVKPKVPKLDTPLTDKELTRLSQLAGIDTNK